jgi:hypothetical protein
MSVKQQFPGGMKQGCDFPLFVRVALEKRGLHRPSGSLLNQPARFLAGLLAGLSPFSSSRENDHNQH